MVPTIFYEIELERYANMSKRNIKPALELPAIFNQAIRDYLGPKRVSELSTDQMVSISRICAEAAGLVTNTIEDGAIFGGPHMIEHDGE